VLALSGADAEAYRRSLAEMTSHFERLMRESRRLIGRSDRAEHEMNTLNTLLQILAHQLEYRATHDDLTGVLNRSAVIDLTRQPLQKNRCCDDHSGLDHFKQVNDEFGHPTGNVAIQGIVGCLRRIVGDAGEIERVGCESFTVLIPAGDINAGDINKVLSLVQAMCEAIACQVFVNPVNRQITVSFGVSANPAGPSFDIAYSSADTALYHAKISGRNRVEVADEHYR